MSVSTFLNSAGLILGFIGACIIWWVSRCEGHGFPFYADTEGKILAEIKAQAAKRDARKNLGMALIAISFFCQLLALRF